MAAWGLYKLTPHRGFHFGVRGVGVEGSAETGGSDTLFGALCQGVRATQGYAGPRGLKTLLAEFADDTQGPPFLLSSLFPFAHDVLLLPRPARPDLPAGVPAAPGGDKGWRKVRYLSWARFGEVYGGVPGAAPLTWDERDRLQHDQVWVTAAERRRLLRQIAPADPAEGLRLWVQGDVPRVTVDRQTNRSQVYQASWVAFPEGAGLYFLVQWRRPDPWQQVLETALEYLGEEGLGGERTAGYGQFTWTEDAAPVPPALPTAHTAPALPVSPGKAAWGMSLALYYPTGELDTLRRSWYHLATRRGWVGAQGALAARRKDVVLLAEGAVLPWPTRPWLGEMVKVTPSDWPPGSRPPPGPLLRYGYALLLPLAYPPEEAAHEPA